MGHHHAHRDIFRKVGDKIDSLHMRLTWNDNLRAIVQTLFSEDEAEVFIRLPYVFSDFQKIQRITKLPEKSLEPVLKRLCEKGLVVDIWARERYYYMPSPIIVGIFEFTMMRTGRDAEPGQWGPLFHRFLENGSGFYQANLSHGEVMSPARVYPHVETVHSSQHSRILDYESVKHIVDSTNTCAVGLCSCRHEKLHAGVKQCDLPLETCMSFGFGADYLIRHNMARQISKEEMKDLMSLSREKGLVFCGDNVRRNPTFICQCCACCCNLLLGVSKHGYANTVVTSSFIAEVDQAGCTGCSKCEKACPVNAITMQASGMPDGSMKKAVVNEEICLGCGVCCLRCNNKSLTLKKRRSRYIHPETTFHRVILQCLERGTLQNQIFDNPESLTQDFMRGLIQGFLRLVPTKQIETINILRSSFLAAATLVVKLQGKGWVTEL